MALRTNSDLITEFLVRNNRTTTDSFITDSTAQGWLKDAHTWAAGYKKWPMTEGKSSTTAASATTSAEGYTTLAYPEGFKADSVRLVTVGGKRFQKTNFYKFQQFFEDNPGDTTNLVTDYGRQLLFNPNAADFTGTVVCWGQYTPALDVTDMTATTIFSDYDEEGNEAIICKMTSYLKQREHLPDEETYYDDKAKAKLDGVKGLINEEQYAYHDTRNDGLFRRFDAIDGGFSDDLYKRDQFGI